MDNSCIWQLASLTSLCWMQYRQIFSILISSEDCSWAWLDRAIRIYTASF
jgi:hypothetical protein